MLPVQNTRASRRAAAAASAHSAVRARRPVLMLGAAVGALLGITVTVGLVSAPASGAEWIDTATAAADVAPGAEPLVEIAVSATRALEDAQDAVSAAEELNAEVASSGLDLGTAPTSVETAALRKDVDALGDRALTPALLLADLTSDAETRTGEVLARTDSLRRVLVVAQQQRAEEQAAEEAAAQAAAEAAALAAANTPEGARATARQLASSGYGWGDDQFSCLESLWNKESGWNYRAYNAGSGATGIPQALPGSKMASAGADWQTSAATQIAWGLGYIASSYGSPCSAWAHSRATDWY